MMCQQKDAPSYRSPLLCPPGLSIVLASASPRRRDLLSAMGLTFTIAPCEVDEAVAPGMPPDDAVEHLAVRKARAAQGAHPDALIIASDTLVADGMTALGKPHDAPEAHAMLARLSGRAHSVHTGVAVLWRDRLLSDRDTTRVIMRPYDDAEIAAYIATGEPMDKAGAYGIQGLGGQLVARYEGAFDTVVGLPTRLLDRLLCTLLEEAEK